MRTAKTATTSKKNNQSPDWLNQSPFHSNENFVTSAAHLNGLVLQTATRFNLETLGFLLHRVQQDLALAEKMSRCKDMAELNEITAKFGQTALEEYSNEASTLANLYSELSSEATQRIQGEFLEAQTATKS